MIDYARSKVAGSAKCPPAAGGSTNYQVMLVSEHAFARLGFRQAVQDCDGFEVCGEAGDCEAVLDKLDQVRTDLVLIDLSLRNGLGLRLVSTAKARHPQVRLVITSMQEDAFYAAQLLSAGAEGYLSNRVDAKVLGDALRQVVQGKVYVSNEIAQSMLHRASGKQNGQSVSLTASLTEREAEVFELLGQGMNTKRIAREMAISAHTVETYRERIRFKIDAKDGADLSFRAIVWSLLNS